MDGWMRYGLWMDGWKIGLVEEGFDVVGLDAISFDSEATFWTASRYRVALLTLVMLSRLGLLTLLGEGESRIESKSE